MDIQGRVAVVTGAAGGIGRALAMDLAQRGARAIAMVDYVECVTSTAEEVQRHVERDVAFAFRGDVTDSAFRRHVFDSMNAHSGGVSICVPAAGITRDALAVREQPLQYRRRVGQRVAGCIKPVAQAGEGVAHRSARLEGVVEKAISFRAVQGSSRHP